ncbi:MAG: hypothetical protein ACI9W4_001515 [Rhodothermales bacterium]|jgi:hypothetical protein
MPRQLFSAGLLACALLFSGCDTVNTAINDALPEISVGDGILGLNGESGVEVTAEFAASKSGAIQATALFSLNETFDDLDTGDIQKLTALSTSLILAAGSSGQLITVNRGSAASLPDAIVVSGGSVTVTLSDGTSTFSMPSTSFGALGTLTRQAGCAADAASCGYIPSVGSSYVLATYSLGAAQASGVLDVVRESTPATPNTLVLTLDLTVSGNDLAGTSASLRVGEFETTVQAEIF